MVAAYSPSGGVGRVGGLGAILPPSSGGTNPTAPPAPYVPPTSGTAIYVTSTLTTTHAVVSTSGATASNKAHVARATTWGSFNDWCSLGCGVPGTVRNSSPITAVEVGDGLTSNTFFSGHVFPTGHWHARLFITIAQKKATVTKLPHTLGLRILILEKKSTGGVVQRASITGTYKKTNLLGTFVQVTLASLGAIAGWTTGAGSRLSVSVWGYIVTTYSHANTTLGACKISTGATWFGIGHP